jgi:hypothetical protein
MDGGETEEVEEEPHSGTKRLSTSSASSSLVDVVAGSGSAS